MTVPSDNPVAKPAPETRFLALDRQVNFGLMIFIVVFPGVIMLSLFGAPRIFYSYRVAHFAAVYILTLSTMAAFKDWTFLNLFWRLAGFVSAVAVTRMIMRHHPETTLVDWFADIGGILGALAPSLVQRYRNASSAIDP